MSNTTQANFFAVELCTYQSLASGGECLARFIECVVPWAQRARIPLRLWVQESLPIKKRKGKKWSPEVWRHARDLLVSGQVSYLTIITDFTPRPGLLPDQLLTFHLQIEFADPTEWLAARIKNPQEVERLRQSRAQMADPHWLRFSLNTRDTNIGLTASEIQQLIDVTKAAFRQLGGASGYITAGSWHSGGGQDHEQRRQFELAEQYGQGDISLEHLNQHDDWLLREDNYDRKLRGVFWGNFLSPQHLTVLGGHARVAREAPCAVIEPIPLAGPSGESITGAYLQLTEDITQTTPAQWQALEEYFSPLLKPPPTGPGQRQAQPFDFSSTTDAATLAVVRTQVKKSSTRQPPRTDQARYLQINLCTYQPLTVGGASIASFVEEAVAWADCLRIPLHATTIPYSQEKKGKPWSTTLWQKYRAALVTGQMSHLRIVNDGAPPFTNPMRPHDPTPRFLLGVDFHEHDERRQDARQQQLKPEVNWVNLSVDLDGLSTTLTPDDVRQLVAGAKKTFSGMSGTCGFISMERIRHAITYEVSTEYEMRRFLYWMAHYNKQQMDAFAKGTLLLTQEDDEAQARTAPARYSERYDTRLRGAFWGNFLGPTHVQLLGGIARLVQESPGFLVEPLDLTTSDGTAAVGAYVQLTEDLLVMSPAQTRALETYLAPVLL